MKPEHREILEAIVNNPRTLNDVRQALNAVLGNNSGDKPWAETEKMSMELYELNERIAKIVTFMKEDEDFAKMTPSQQLLLEVQKDAMVTYSRILAARLSL